MRSVYSGLFYLLVPFILLRLFWRGKKVPQFRQRWHERFACYKKSSKTQQLIWFHAVSVGEVESVFPLIKVLQQRLPQYSVLVTTITPTGSERVRSVLSDSVQHVYLPYDLPGAAKRFVEFFQPQVAIIVETEIWPNLFAQCKKHEIPLYIINARLSERSVKGYQRFSGLVASALANVQLIATQTEQDRQRYLAIGAHPQQVSTLGNIKFDLQIDRGLIQQGLELRQASFPRRHVWIVASTHRGEEVLFLKTYRLLKKQFPDLLLIIVPRNQERFDEVKKLCIDAQFDVVMRTDARPCRPETDVYIGDTMGDLKLLYAASDIAFVAGSMQPIGGHNVLEAAILGIPVLFGPHMFNFKAIAEGLLAEEAAIQCQDEHDLEKAMRRLLTDRQYQQQLGAKGKAFVLKNQGALQAVYKLVTQKLR